MKQGFKIKGKPIGHGCPAYIVAEISANHHQEMDQAIQMIYAAKEAGADAVKLQTYTPDTLTIDCDNEYFRIHGTIWDGKTLYELYQEAFTPWEWHSALKKQADNLGLALLSTPFDETAVDFLEELNIPAYKVASFEIVDLPLLRKVAQTGKPVILSTGMASMAEIDEAISVLRNEGCENIVLLKCTSAYPAPLEELNLLTIPHMSHTFQIPVGLSDHTLSTTVPIAAVALNACVVEKHFTLSREVPGPDSAFSLEPVEFKKMSDQIRDLEKAIGVVCYEPGEAEKRSKVFRRSLFVVKDMARGEAFTSENVRSIRPGYGMHTRETENVLGRRARVDIRRGTPLAWPLVD